MPYIDLECSRLALGRQIRALEYRALAHVELDNLKGAVNDYESLSKIPDVSA